jgi:hypothetical protein
MARVEDFDRSVPLPRGLTVIMIRNAIDYLERELPELIEIHHEQANVFSGISEAMFESAAISRFRRTE